MRDGLEGGIKGQGLNGFKCKKNKLNKKNEEIEKFSKVIFPKR